VTDGNITGLSKHRNISPDPSSPSELELDGRERVGLYISLAYVKVGVFDDPEEGAGQGKVR
jgi:hypothetical protein